MSELTREQVKLWTIGDVNTECSACRWVAESDYAALRAQLQAQTKRAEQAWVDHEQIWQDKFKEMHQHVADLTAKLADTQQHLSRRDALVGQLEANLLAQDARLNAAINRRVIAELECDRLRIELNALKAHDANGQTIVQRLAAMTAKRDEHKEMAEWFLALVPRANIGTEKTPSLRAYIEQVEQQLTAMTEERDRWKQESKVARDLAGMATDQLQSMSCSKCIEAQALKHTLYKERNQLRAMLDRIDAIPEVADGYHAPNEENIADGVEALAENYREAQDTVTAQGEELGRLLAVRMACQAIPVWSAKYAQCVHEPFNPILFGQIMGELAQAIGAIERALAATETT